MHSELRKWELENSSKSRCKSRNNKYINLVYYQTFAQHQIIGNIFVRNSIQCIGNKFKQKKQHFLNNVKS